MRIAGRRADGALYLSLGGGVAVILKGYYVTPSIDATVVDAMGPWESANNEYAERVRVERALDCASLAPMAYFDMAFGAVAEKKEDASPFAAGDTETEKKGVFAKAEGDQALPSQKGPFAKEKKESPVGEKETSPFGLDKFHSLDETSEEKEKKPVSEVAQAAQAGDAAAPPVPPGAEVLNLMPVVDPAEERKKKRGALKDKVKAAARSKGRTADVLADEDISDEDLFAMAKELGVTLDETPGAVTLVDNATKFSRLLASTTIAKHIHLAGGEHPFTYCMENVVPAMEKEGKGPDDPEAFCAYWKQENS